MQTFKVTLTGRTPLLMHRDNIEWTDGMKEWRDNADNQKNSVKGDDRSPPWTWLGSVYYDEIAGVLAIPQENIMKSLMEGGAMVPVPGGRSGKTFKSQTQSGMLSVEQFWPLEIAGGPVKWEDVKAASNAPKFMDHKPLVAAMGFSLLVKRAAVGTNKHVRVRPQFPAGWRATGSIAVWDEQITKDALAEIFKYAGQYKGLGDWRPGAPKKPGPYGTFDAKLS